MAPGGRGLSWGIKALLQATIYPRQLVQMEVCGDSWEPSMIRVTFQKPRRDRPGPSTIQPSACRGITIGSAMYRAKQVNMLGRVQNSMRQYTVPRYPRLPPARAHILYTLVYPVLNQ